jgi:hypothetical protein
MDAPEADLDAAILKDFIAIWQRQRKCSLPGTYGKNDARSFTSP